MPYTARHAVRDYRPGQIDKNTIQTLLDAAVHAPTAMHEEPCAFVIVQNKNLLNRLSEAIQSHMRTKAEIANEAQTKQLLDFVNQPGFNAFYNANTLIIIYSQFKGEFVSADCWLAAENLMLTATSLGMGSCVIGLAVDTLNTPEWKAELGVSKKMTAIAPMIIGFPAEQLTKTVRHQAEIIAWK